MRFLFALLVFVALPVQAFELDGNFSQGGVVFGTAEPGAEVKLNGKAVTVAENGAFVIGFARDAKPQATLTVTEKGQTTTQSLSIAKVTYKIQRIDGLPTRKVTPNPKDVARIKKDNAGIWGVRGSMSAEPRFLSGFIWPVKGPISGVFGSQRILNGKPKSPHNGVDVAAPRGMAIVAPADGVVALVHQDMFYTGKTVMIDHGLGLTTVYAHMDDVAVIEGQVLSQGDTLGTVGKTGRTTGPHLHWGMTWKSTHVDPSLVTGPMAQN
ncbi:M23 family metallopeptidase [Magnetovibrio sp. PR-2]|uniref:M23 family metallopeptidase n=1 Tax=Magnetovibrio sp. PR-2 TaxID=3120356 RepID=UPI002FCE04A0